MKEKPPAWEGGAEPVCWQRALPDPAGSWGQSAQLRAPAPQVVRAALALHVRFTDLLAAFHKE